ncbi:hypothetical protein EI94DRAFT_1836746 [Lactarius quietus]|nr:hypothetical protein EI94DRAFT_1836746 [Lactarius quietus]
MSPSLENLASYATPQQQPPEHPTQEGRDETPGQKRKRTTTENTEQSDAPTQSDQQVLTRELTPEDQPQNTPGGQANKNPPHVTPSPARPPLTYKTLQNNRAPTRSPTPSPTSEAQKRRKTRDDRGHDMAVDEENNHQVDQNTPTAANGRTWYEETPDRQAGPQAAGEDDPRERTANVMVEIDEIANAKTLARILTVSDKTTGNGDTLATSDPLDKYTEGPMPNIYDEAATTLLAGIDKAQIHSWLTLPTGKVLARPFDSDANYRPNHQNVAQALIAATREITGALTPAVAPPNKDPNAPRSQRHPITFLIHNISKEDESALLDRKVWSSKEITFQVESIYIKRPEFMFTLSGFSCSQEVGDVEASIAEVWGDQRTLTLIRELADLAQTQEEAQEWHDQMQRFLESATVQYLGIRGQGGIEKPHFNVYANGELIEDDEIWDELRKSLRGRVYRTMTIGTGRPLVEDFICGLCHGHDHPRGLCPFPKVPGWNGGGYSRTPLITYVR